MTRILLAAALAALLAAPASAAAPPLAAKAVADPTRPKEDRAADSLRKPAETLTFAGLRPGMTVGELFPGSGYFTRLIADVVGPTGHIYAMENAKWAAKNFLAERVRPNVSFEAKPFGQFALPDPVDLIWVTQNYHDLKIAEYGAVDTADFNRRVFAALKPGGTYFILDHEAPRGTTTEAIAKIHRIEKAQVIREVEAAGFKLAAQGAFLHRPEDDHTRSIFDKAIQGRTDQYALRFVKPAR